MTEPTRVELLEAHNAYLSVWLEAAETEHAEMTVLLGKAEDAQDHFLADNQRLRDEVGPLRLELEILRLNIAKRGCCKVE